MFSLLHYLDAFFHPNRVLNLLGSVLTILNTLRVLEKLKRRKRRKDSNVQDVLAIVEGFCQGFDPN